jgi:hypothetical protein
MPKFSHPQNNFLSGELSPRAYGRTELQEYQQGAADIFNKWVLPQGGVQRRTGSQYLDLPDLLFQHVGKNVSVTAVVREPIGGAVRIFPFVSSANIPYLIVLKVENNVCRFACVDLRNNESIDVVVEVPIFWGPGASTDAVDTKKPSGYVSQKELDEVQFAQNGDLVFMVHPNHDPIYFALTVMDKTLSDVSTTVDTYKLILAHHSTRVQTFGEIGLQEFRTSSDNYDNQNLVPYDPFNSNVNVTITTAARPGPPSDFIRITASQGLFVEDDNNRFFQWSEAGNTRTAVIFDWDVGTVVDGVSTAADALLINGSSTFVTGAVSWRKPLWREENGFPRTLTFFEQRTCYGGIRSFPDTIYGSQIGDLLELRTDKDAQDPDFGTVTNDDPFEFTVASTEVNQIQWLSSGKQLNIGTLGREYTAGGSQGAMGPEDVSISAETSHGSAFLQPVRLGNQVVFVQRSQRKVRQFIFNRDENSFVSRNLSILADHISDKSALRYADFGVFKIEQMVHQEADNSIVWFLDNQGGLFGMTLDKEFGIVAWHIHEIAGTYRGGKVPVLNMAVVPSKEREHDDLYITVRREINGTEEVQIEKIGKSYKYNNIYNESVKSDDKSMYSDSSALVFAKPPSAISNLRFLASYDKGLDALYIDLDTKAISGNRFQDGPQLEPIEVGATIFGSAQEIAAEIDNDLLSLNGQGELNYAQVSEIFDTGSFTVRALIVPEYSGTPSAVQRFFRVGEYQLYHDLSGDLNLDGNSLAINFGSWSPTADTQYEIEVNVLGSSGTIRVFIDGTQQGSTHVEGSSIPTSVQDVVLSTIDGSLTGNSDFLKYAQFQVYDNVQHTANYTPADLSVYTAGTSISGLSHLEGETVQVVADGNYVGEKTVASGAITLDVAAVEAIVGLKYRSLVKTLPVEDGSNLGSAQLGKQRTDRVMLRFTDTIGGKIGIDDSDLQDIIFREGTLPVEDPIPLFSGDKVVNLDDNSKERSQIVVVQDLPFPMTLNAIYSRGQTND